MQGLSNYAFSSLRDGDLALYRGSGAGLPPILLLAAENGSRGALRRLEHEYGLATQLVAAGAVTPVALTRHEGRTVLILQDPGGEPLDRILERNPGQPLDLIRFLRIAIPLTSAIRRLHEHGLIHKDIKPANILVDVASGGVRLMGFGIASRLPRERQAPEAPEVIAGTFAYMAPEQTGRMNRSIDARSDLYSLGVTLYQMLTGNLPFAADDPLEWIHCHIARQPTSPGDRAAVPELLSTLVLKLLAKSAEERYQTAAGVEADLLRCLADWESHGHIDPFPLGERDVSDRLLIPEKLYGREREIDALLASFERVVATGIPELVLVSGYSGIGKSSVVNELHKALVPSRGLFASGKFDQYKRNIPYVTLAQAFQGLVRPLLGYRPAQLRRWGDALREALAPYGQLIVNLVPELELIIGKQPPVEELPLQDAKNRFQRVFGRFLGVFARQEHPLMLFLDDVQWLDVATLDLLEHVLTHAVVRHLLVVGAFRDNEVGPEHPLMRTLAAIRNANACVREIVLAPLGLEDVGRLVADTLHCEPERARPLAQLVEAKTGGNPFFTIQLLSALAEEGVLVFDPDVRAWQWELDRIRARTYSDNVVDLVAEKMKRLRPTTQEALRQFAPLGNVAAIDILTLIHGQPEATLHAALEEAAHAGLVVRLENTYKFLHDRIQQAAYLLIPAAQRAAVHLDIGRVLLAGLTADELDEQLFEVTTQFNRGAKLLVGRHEQIQVATLALRAGRKARASAAYASARAYYSAGIALLDEADWSTQYELTFRLSLEGAQCELLSGHFGAADRLLVELLQRGTSKLDLGAAYHLKVQLHAVKGEYAQAVDNALTCLRLFGIDLPAHPTWEQVQAGYETVWQTLGGRSIESLIDLPLLTDPELQVVMQVFLDLTPAAYLTDFHLSCLQQSHVVKLSIQHGISGASAHAFGYWGTMLGPIFHRYRDAYRLAKLGCDLVDKHGFTAHRAHVHYSMGRVAFWTQPIATAIDYMRANSRALIETGDLTLACHSRLQAVAGLLLRNDPLDEVWRESESALHFAAEEAKYRDAVDIIRSQQRFITAMQGRDAKFDEVTFEAQMTADRTRLTLSLYWILKLKTRFLLGDHAEALAAADEVKPLLSAAPGQIQVLDYFYYTALALAACYQDASADERTGWCDLLRAHQEQLREWADNYPPTFGDKYALVSAEIARLEGRDRDAVCLYEQAIRLARENGFVQNEALAHEVAAGFYATCGVESTTHTYLRNARHGYLRWGALGKVRQLERRHPWLAEESPGSVAGATIDAPVERLDVGSVVKASQAVSSEIELGKLIETLMRISLEHAGGERGLLILVAGDEPRIAAEARTAGGDIEVTLRNDLVTPAELIESVLHTTLHSRESVILDDAARIPSSADGSFRQKAVRSVLCLPLVKQGKLVGALYLENNLTPRVFTSTKLAVLELLASQAAISLENVRLYNELRSENSERRRAEAGLRRSEAYLSEAQKLSHTGSFGWRPSSGELYWAEETFRIFEYEPGTRPTLERLLLRIHPDDVADFSQVAERASQDGQDFAHEYRLRMPDERVKQIHVVARAFRDATADVEFIGAVMDVTAIRVAERELHKTRTDLAHVMRVTSLGELTASIAHEVNQPLGAVMFNVEACQSWLARDPPNMKEAHAALERIIRDGTRAGEVIRRIRAVAKKTDIKMAPLNLHDVLGEALTFIQHEVLSSGVVVHLEHAIVLPIVLADKVQLQQVILNLVMNGIEAMHSITDRPRELTIRSEQDAGHARVTVIDCGVGFSAASAGRLFNTFFTTKSGGMGMGLSICRSIVELHGGRIWATPHVPHGATIQFTLPLQRAEASDRTSPQPPISARWRL